METTSHFYIKIVYQHNIGAKESMLKAGSDAVFNEEISTKAVEMCHVL
jgi:hypothetical protein